MARGMADVYARCCVSAAPSDGRRGMKIVYFTHSLRSCWNHGNAHFLRGVLSELIARGHDVRVFEPEGAWSLSNLLAGSWRGGAGRPSASAYPELTLAHLLAARRGRRAGVGRGPRHRP